MDSKRIVVEVVGGVVNAVYTNIADVDVTLVDWDELDESESISVCAGALPAISLDLMTPELKQALRCSE